MRGRGPGSRTRWYEKAGATILSQAREVYAKCAMVMHVKEPQPQEYELIREGQILFTYFHFAASEELTRAMIARKAVCIAYETIMTVMVPCPC